EGQLTLEHQRVVEREIGLEVSADDRDGATATGKTDCRCQRFGRPRRLDHHVRAETPVAAATTSAACSGATAVAPSRSASPRRAATPSTAISFPAILAAHITAISPTGPHPTTATTSQACTPPCSTAPYPVGRMSARKPSASSDTPSGSGRSARPALGTRSCL